MHYYYLKLGFFIGCILIIIGFLGFVTNNKTLIVSLIFLEVIFLGFTFNFLIISNFFFDSFGLIFSIVLIGVAAAESVIGLALIILYHRLANYLMIEKINYLKG